jgi:2-oxoisovalerate dehydrogenase E2 component (dihydrolipoyl transacylase)
MLAAAPPVSGAAHFPRLASPSTRRRAKERGISLDQVKGTGPRGRILVEDLESFAAAHAAPLTVGAQAGEEISEMRIIGLRRKIAEKMQDAKRRIPHIAYVEECDLTELEALRITLNEHRAEDQPKLTLLPLLIRAMIRALPEFPQINARFDDDAGLLRTYGAVHVGIATQTPGGLMVPVVRHAERLDVWECAREIARLSKAARDGSASRDELSGSTITVTSLGPLGGIVTTPVINHPEVAIIGPNKLVDRPVVNGSFVTVRKMMNISSSFDHRIVDGYDAASFIQTLKRLLEHPALIFMA